MQYYGNPISMNRLKLSFIACGILTSFHGLAANQADLLIDFSPQKVFARESTAVTVFVTYKDPKIALKRVALQRLDENGKVTEDMGDLYDHGRSGDPVAQDGKFGRKIQFTEKKKKHITFLIKADTSTGTIEKQFEIQVLQRPSFLETLKLIWIRRELNQKLKELKTTESFLEYIKARPDVARASLSPDQHVLVDFKNGTQLEF